MTTTVPRWRGVELALAELEQTTIDSDRRRIRNAAIEESLSLADRLASKYFDSDEPHDDLRQVARLALVKAIDGYRPDAGRPFLAYAIPTIDGALKRHFRDHCWSMRMPRRLQEMRLRVRNARFELAQRLKRTPTLNDIAAATELDLDDVRSGHDADRLYRIDSIDRHVTMGSAEALQVGLDDPEIGCTEDRLAVQRMLSTLPKRQRRILHLRYFDGLSQAAIATQIGVSQMQVSRLIKDALHRLGDIDRGRLGRDVGAVHARYSQNRTVLR